MKPAEGCHVDVACSVLGVHLQQLQGVAQSREFLAFTCAKYMQKTVFISFSHKSQGTLALPHGGHHAKLDSEIHHAKCGQTLQKSACFEVLGMNTCD